MPPSLITPSLIIIGAGIGGLAAGCYAQMNGFETAIFESHDKPGGVCTSWRRGDYWFDGCIHHLAGAGSGSPMHRIWQELGALLDERVLFFDELTRVEGPDGKTFIVYTDAERLEQHMLELAPDDAKPIRAYARAAARFGQWDLLAMQLGGKALLGALPHLPDMMRWVRVTLEQYAMRFRDPFLRAAFPWIQYDFAGIPAAVNLYFIGNCGSRTLGWPIGGSLRFAERIAARYQALGGEITYHARVDKVLVENDRAVGVRLSDGSERRADIVISNADGYTTLFGMLGGRYLDDRIRRYYRAAPERQDMSLHVCLGVARDLNAEPHAITMLLPEPLKIGGSRRERLDLEIFGSKMGVAPEGKGVIKVPLDARYEHWQTLLDENGRRGARYREAKQAVAEQVIALVEGRFPGIRQQIEVIDVSTPLTIERYVGSYHGYQAWGLPGGNPLSMFRGVSKTVPGLAGFHMVGQWAGGTIGISTVTLMARALVQSLCREASRRFMTQRA